MLRASLWEGLPDREASRYHDPRTAHTLRYRARYEPRLNTYADIFDGAHYRHLHRRVTTLFLECLDLSYSYAQTVSGLILMRGGGHGPWLFVEL